MIIYQWDRLLGDVVMQGLVENFGITFIVAVAVTFVFTLLRLRVHIESIILGMLLRVLPDKIEGKTKRRLLRWLTLEINWTNKLIKESKTAEEEKEFTELLEWLIEVKESIKRDHSKEDDLELIRVMLTLRC